MGEQTWAGSGDKPAGDDFHSREWHEARLAGVGSSEAAAVVGLSPWQTPLGLWAKKRGVLRGDKQRSDRDRDRLRFGNLLEDVIAAEYSTRTGRKVRRKRDMVKHRTHPNMFTHLDRLVWPVGPKDSPFPDETYPGTGACEIKSTSRFVRHEWEPDSRVAPIQYQIQMQHHLACTGWMWGCFVVLVDKDEFFYFDVLRDDGFIKRLEDSVSSFWGLVESGDEPTAGAYDSEVLSRMYPEHKSGASLSLPDEAREIDFNLTRVKAKVKELQDQKSELENRLKQMMGEAEFAYLPDDLGSYSWRASERRTAKKLADIPVEIRERVERVSTVRTLRRSSRGRA